ncbi:MAG: Lrp/AsnC family transcriptional regulator [Candidatus Thermoplasmatota archaeon]|jgi:DNA-binding Lrp family transcriptional regulator|nr:Lrp/AsnC family transcriptional regulator [Candidatus Thermoplasmatota archaeon]MCL5790896.1 Lrp/AsnC family transcriptional regulator [Candidatus Thermoplasmatota archaeon]
MEQFTVKGIRLDDKDSAILSMLKECSRISNVEIAKRLGITEGTVRRRIHRLVEEKIIKRFTVEINDGKKEAIILAKCEPAYMNSILQQIRKKFDRIYEVSGKNDIAIVFEYVDLETLNDNLDVIRSVTGIRNTETLIRLK